MTHRQARRVLLAAIATGTLVATACTPGQVSTSPSPGTSEKPQLGGRIIEGRITDIAGMQPALSNDAASSRVINLIYDNLIQQDHRNGEAKPKLATFTASSNGLSYTFEINSKANWSDGKPIIAEDYLTAVKIVGKSAKTVRRSSYQDVQGFGDYREGKAATISGIAMDGANAKKFTVTMTKVSCPALLDLNTMPPLPTQVFGKYVSATSKDQIDTASENVSPTVFSGPFKFKEWRRGDQVILSRNETYWQGAPHVDEYVYKVVANQSAVATGLKTGEIIFGSIEAKDFADMQSVDTVRVNKYPSLGYTFIGWNTRSPSATGLADKRVRQALAYGIDMDQVIKAVVFGEATRNLSHHVPVQWAYPSAVQLEQYRYDKAKAEQLLKDAGWTKGADGILAKDGKRFNLTISTQAGHQERETLAQVAVEQYKQLGINAQARPEAFQGLVTKLATGDSTLEATIIAWTLGGDVDPYPIWHSSQIPNPAATPKVEGFGLSGFKDGSMDKAIEEARNPSNGDCSTAARKRQYETFNKVLNENQPYNFGYVNNVLNVNQKSLQNFNPASYSTIHNVHEWWIKN